jgi:hypothetical protein
MARPWLKPKVTMTKQTSLSWEELRARVSGKPKFVRVGLPDTVSTTEGNQVRKARKRGKRK